MLDHFLPLLFPKDSESLKVLDIQLRKVGAKRPLNGTSKVNRHTDGHTDTRTEGHTDRRTFQLIESIGPEGRCFENLGKALVCLQGLVNGLQSAVNIVQSVGHTI